LVLGLSGALSLKAEAPSVRAGGQATVGLDIDFRDKTGAPVPKATLTLTSQVGSVGPLKEVAPGRYHATFSAPKEKYPQVAILIAEAKTPEAQERAWLPLPVLGVETLKLSTKPKAKVEVTVVARTFGPLAADALGAVSVPVEVPPGVEVARVRSVDRLGNVREKTVPLTPPPFSRVRLLPAAGAEATASWAAKPFPLEIYAVELSGQPSDAIPPNLTASVGSCSAPILRAPGVWIANYLAPDRVGDGRARVQATVHASTLASELLVALHPGPPARVNILPSSPEARAGQEPLPFEVSATDVKDNPVTITDAQVTSTLGKVEPAGSPAAYRLLLPASWAGQTAVTLTARVGEAQGQRTLPLRAGPPAQGTARADRRLVYPGEAPLAVELELRDAAGNLPQDTPIQATSDVGTVSRVDQPSPGHYALSLDIPEDAPLGEGHVRAGTPELPALVSTPFSVMPRRRAWGLSLGPWASFHTNFRGSSGVTPTLDLAVRPARFPLELVLQAGYGLYRPIRRDYPAAGPGVDQLTQFHTVNAVLGVRAWLPLSNRLSLHAAALAGVVWTRAQSRLENSATPDLLFPAQAFSFAAQASAGVGVRAGPGRFMAELQFLYFRVSTAAIQGNPGGLGVSLGYLVELH
jgi:hypothetical protein